MRRLSLLLILPVLALPGCGGGGGDEEEVERVVREWAEAATERDGERFCGDLVADEFVEQVTGATGDNAREQCRQLLEVTTRGLTVKVLDVKRVTIEGDRARAVTEVETQGERREQTFSLVKQDGDFRITSNAAR